MLHGIPPVWRSRQEVVRYCTRTAAKCILDEKKVYICNIYNTLLCCVTTLFNKEMKPFLGGLKIKVYDTVLEGLKNVEYCV